MIQFQKQGNIFTLDNGRFSYVFHINAVGVPVKLYLGPSLPSPISEEEIQSISDLSGDVYAYYDREKKEEHSFYKPYYSAQQSPLEVPPHMSADMRGSLIAVIHEDESAVTDFRYFSHEIIKGKTSLNGLPYCHGDEGECETLILTLKDQKAEVYVHCYYTIYKNSDVIVRHNKIENRCKNPINLTKAFSICLDLPRADYRLLSIHGTYASDRLLEEQDLYHNEVVLSDIAGAKGFDHNPVAMLKQVGSNESSGEVIGVALVYSSNFKISVTRTSLEGLRLLAGISDYEFDALLESGTSFETPEAILAYSSQGSDDITHTFHDFVRNHLLRKLPEDKRKCILLNSWEGDMFDFNTEKILSFLKKGKEMGIDLFVLDDGWFRNDDTYGLGDWNVDQRKIDLHKVIDEAHQLGIRFGLWVEPEQISFASRLYEENEDFALYDHSLQKPTTLRHQFVLDLTNEKARDTVFAEISRIFDGYHLDYCKWDFNRMLTEAHSSTYQKKYGSIFHQFVMGSYDLLDRFVKRYPNVILETCSGGGGRFDFGMLYYSHQIWASDETDVIPRSEIQYSTNLFYPMQCIGAHISARKLLSISEKGALAMFGTFGYELNPLLLNQNDMEEVHLANERFLENYDIVMKGDYYPLLNPFEGNFVAWEMVDKEKDNAVVYFMNYRHINWRARFIKLRGLDPNKQYHNNLDNLYHSGAYYEQIGLNLSVGMPSFTPQIIELRAK